MEATITELGGFVRNRHTQAYDLMFVTQIGSELLTKRRAIESAQEKNGIADTYDINDVIVRKRTATTTYSDWETL